MPKGNHNLKIKNRAQFNRTADNKKTVSKDNFWILPHNILHHFFTGSGISLNKLIQSDVLARPCKHSRLSSWITNVS